MIAKSVPCSSSVLCALSSFYCQQSSQEDKDFRDTYCDTCTITWMDCFEALVIVHTYTMNKLPLLLVIVIQTTRILITIGYASVAT